MVDFVEMKTVIPGDEVSSFGRKLDEVRELREKISVNVLGHVIKEPDWMVFDDALTHEYDRLADLLRVLEEKAG